MAVENVRVSHEVTQNNQRRQSNPDNRSRTLQTEATEVRKAFRREVPAENIERAKAHIKQEQTRLMAELAEGNWTAARVTTETLLYLSVPDEVTINQTMARYADRMEELTDLHDQHQLPNKNYRAAHNKFAEGQERLQYAVERSAPSRRALEMLIAVLDQKIAAQDQAEQAQQTPPNKRKNRPLAFRQLMKWGAVAGLTLTLLNAGMGKTNAEDLQEECNTQRDAQISLVNGLNDLGNEQHIESAIDQVMVQCAAVEEINVQALFNSVILINPEANTTLFIDGQITEQSAGALSMYPNAELIFNEEGTAPDIVTDDLGNNFYRIAFGPEYPGEEGTIFAGHVLENPPEQMFAVALPGSNIRSGPSTEAARVAQTVGGETFLLLDPLTGNSTNWVEVVLNDGSRGWMREDRLEGTIRNEAEVIGRMPVVVRTPNGQSFETDLDVAGLNTLGLNSSVLQYGLEGLRTFIGQEVVNPANLRFVVAVPEWPSTAAEQQAVIQASLSGDTFVNELLVEVLVNGVANEAGNLLIISTTQEVPADATEEQVRFNYIESYAYIGVGQLIDRVFEFRSDLGDRASFEENHQFSLIPQRDGNGTRRLNIIVDGNMIGAVLLDNLAQNGGRYDGTSLVLAAPGMETVLATGGIQVDATATPIYVGDQAVEQQGDGGESFYILASSNEGGGAEVSSPLEVIAMEWPLASPENAYSGTYSLRCAVEEIIYNSEISGDGTGRFIIGSPGSAETLESMMDIRCTYLAADGSEQELLIPMAFVHTRNGQPQSFTWGALPADFRFYDRSARDIVQGVQGVQLGDVMSVSFNMSSNPGFGWATDESIIPLIPQVMTESMITQFAETGQASIFGDNFLPIDVSKGVPDPYPDNIDLTSSSDA